MKDLESTVSSSNRENTSESFYLGEFFRWVLKNACSITGVILTNHIASIASKP